MRSNWRVHIHSLASSLAGPAMIDRAQIDADDLGLSVLVRELHRPDFGARQCAKNELASRPLQPEAAVRVHRGTGAATSCGSNQGAGSHSPHLGGNTSHRSWNSKSDQYHTTMSSLPTGEPFEPLLAVFDDGGAILTPTTAASRPCVRSC